MILLYTHMQKQLNEAFGHVWKKDLKIKAGLFDMFFDTISRLAPISKPESSDTNTASADSTNTASIPADTPSDLGSTVLLPPNSYYESLFMEGFTNNEVQNVNAASMFSNYALLHMAQYNIGAESLVAGIRAYFNDSNNSGDTNSANTELTNTTSTNENPETSSDIDWSLITQDKLQEPLFSLYTKEVLSNGFVPLLTANGTTITRNSYYIPDFNLIDTDGETIEIKWNGFRSVTIDVNSGSYRLDTERTVPQKSYVDSFYSFDSTEMALRGRITAMADRYKAQGEFNTQNQIDLIE